MKKITVLIVLICMYLSLGVAFAVDDEVIAKFTESLSAQQLEEVVEDSGILVREVYFQQGEIQGGYTLKHGETIYSAVENLTERHIEALSNMLSILDKTPLSYDSDEQKREDVLYTSISSAFSKVSKHGIRVSSVRLLNNPAVQKLLKSGIVESIKPVQKSFRRGKDSQLKNGSQFSLFQSIFDFLVPNAYAGYYYVREDLWAPRYGSSKTSQYMAFNTFYFTDASGFDFFGGILTYEHETQVYDKNFVNYDNYWSSNLPMAYYDTPFLDSIDNFTIGSAQASSIIEDQKYWTYMALHPQTALVSNVVIKGQLGHRYPSWCYSTWCIYADMTTGWLTDYVAPIINQQSWTYNP